MARCPAQGPCLEHLPAMPRLGATRAQDGSLRPSRRRCAGLACAVPATCSCASRCFRRGNAEGNISNLACGSHDPSQFLWDFRTCASGKLEGRQGALCGNTAGGERWRRMRSRQGISSWNAHESFVAPMRHISGSSPPQKETYIPAFSTLDIIMTFSTYCNHV